MSVILVSSLDALSRQAACAALAAESPDALVLLHDLLEDGRVVRRVFKEGRRVEHSEVVLEHPCLSCAVRLDMVPAVRRLLDSGARVIVGLPPAAASETAVHALLRGLRDAVAVDSVVLACAPDSVEDQIWDHRTLFESGYTPVVADDRTAGEFLVRELCFADTVLLAEPPLVPVDPAARHRGGQLVRELAPHAVLEDCAGDMRTGSHSLAGATARTAPGDVRAAPEPSRPFTTVVQRIERPLHPERFRHALATLAEACCWLRGRLWVASAPGCRIAIQGVGPRIWLENTGPWQAERKAPHFIAGMAGISEMTGQDPDGWHPEYGDRGTVLAFTGDDMDAAEIAELLGGCELSGAEMAAAAWTFPDPFHLNETTDTSQRSNP